MILGFANRDCSRSGRFRESCREWRKMGIENDRSRRRSRCVFRRPGSGRRQACFGKFSSCRRKNCLCSGDDFVVESKDFVFREWSGSFDLLSLLMCQCTAIVVTSYTLEVVRAIPRRPEDRFQLVPIFRNRSINVRDAVGGFGCSSVVDVDVHGLIMRMCRNRLGDVRRSLRHEEFENFAVLTERIWTLQLL